MKKHSALYLATFIILLPAVVHGQWINCSATSIPGEFATGPMIDLTVGSSTPTPVLSVNPSGADTPTHEYAITLSGVAAADGLGHELVGADADGVFDPADFGIASGQAFCITPVSYNIAQVRHMLDSILINATVCCPILDLVTSGFCDTLNHIGFASGSDVQDLNDVYQVIKLFSSDSTISLEGFVFRITEVNNSGGILPPACGGGAFPICYAIKDPFTQQCYQYGPAGVAMLAEPSSLRLSYSGHDLRVTFTTRHSGWVSVELYDITGRALDHTKADMGSGDQAFSFRAPEAQVIIVRLLTEHQSITQRICRP